jgi:type VI secretion system secreted protein Hcp
MKKEKICLSVCVLILVFIIAMPASVVCAEMFLMIQGVRGESTDKDHDGWIDVLSFSGSLTRPGSGVKGTSPSRGTVSMGDISVTKEIDKASPKLNDALSKGTHFPEIELEMRAATGGSGQSIIYTLKDVVIGSIAKSGKNEIVRFRFKSGTYAVLLSK